MKTHKSDETNVLVQIHDLQVKIEEMENNKRNNLIIYGLANDPYETHSSLHQKVRNIHPSYFLINHL